MPKKRNRGKEEKPKRLTMGKLKSNADRALQDFYRRTFSDKRCEMCGKPFYCMHHFITKSSSNYLRYDEFNLVRVCVPCHSKFHIYNDPEYPVRLAEMRGPAWADYIRKHRHEKKIDNRKELEQLTAFYEDN
jgi:5-methylcytosine-specific restriction endonuclease McrA